MSARTISSAFDSLSNVKIRNLIGAAADTNPKNFNFNSNGQIIGWVGNGSTTAQSINAISRLKAARIAATNLASSTGAGLSSSARLAAKYKKTAALLAGSAILSVPGALETIMGKRDCSTLEGEELSKCEEKNAEIDNMIAQLKDPVGSALKFTSYAIAAFIIILLIILLF